MTRALAAAERGWLPDGLIRLGIRSLLRARLELERRRAGGDLEQAADAHLSKMRRSLIAVAPSAANDQHYETPAAFFRLMLGPRLKYSAGLWPGGVTTPAGAESAMLEATAERAGVEDGMRVLDLGCGWGALSLWMAERYPLAHVTAVSNSSGQARYIMKQRDRLGLGNLQVVTADMNDFRPAGKFDRIVSVEMFEHMRNYERLLGRIASWLRPGGALLRRGVGASARCSWSWTLKAAGGTLRTGMWVSASGGSVAHSAARHVARSRRSPLSAWSSKSSLPRTRSRFPGQLPGRASGADLSIAPHALPWSL